MVSLKFERHQIIEGMNDVSSLILNHGLIVNAQGIQLSDFISYDLKPHHINDCIKNTSFHTKLVNSTTKKDSFLLKNLIELSADELKHICQIFDADKNINSAMALLDDESSTNDIFLMIQCTKVEVVIKKGINPSDELTNKVKEALKHYDPYHKLMAIFNNYGYFLPRKVVLGHKIYRMTYLTADQNLEPNEKNNETKWLTLDDFSESKFEDILNQWEKCMSFYNFDLSYLVSINGELIMKSKIKKWIEFCLESDLDSLQIIGCKELYPLYEIFDLPLRQEVESVLGISKQIEYVFSNQFESVNRNNVKERVLMAGIVPIKDPPYSYGVNFPVRFKSNNYQVFGKLIAQEDEPIDDVIIKFDFMDTYGFLIFMENYRLTYENSKIAWILIGTPAEVGYVSQNTRKIKVLDSGNESFALKSNDNNVVLKILENLPNDSIIVFSFKHPPSNYESNFTAKIQNYQDNQISLNIYCPNYESSDSQEYNEESKSFDHNTLFQNDTYSELSNSDDEFENFEVSIRWFILLFLEDFNEAEVVPEFTATTINLKAIGQKIKDVITTEPLNVFRLWELNEMNKTIPEFSKGSQINLKHPVILLVGKTGAGKSTLGNLLLDQPYDEGPFIVSDRIDSCTQICGESEVTIDGQKFNLVDTPGIFDTKKPDKEVYKEIAKTVQKCAYGVKAILFVFEAKRFTEEQNNILNGVKTFLGEDALNYMIAVFSHATKKQNADKDEMRKAWNSTIASFIGNLGNRWGISPNSDYFPPEHEKHQLRLREIKDFIMSTSGSYTTDMLESVRQEQERIQREKEEEERRIRAEYEEKLRNEGKEQADSQFQEQMNKMRNEFERKQNDSLAALTREIARLQQKIEEAEGGSKCQIL
ncbi:P-loop containing nucleoside triphosphate hydrolase protein [Gigaspora margarita]|uniref:P-loop containing nucleoside triphosphate hydrolase protein n=1 Tax=Gigaspora margarita TaxID=4874 RepID=A0A8H4AR20_GIGMA|nr:P-loop containing nucleoside triphosphate hydrolase protein [Gigaspora margarita]